MGCVMRNAVMGFLWQPDSLVPDISPSQLEILSMGQISNRIKYVFHAWPFVDKCVLLYELKTVCML